jgi:Flp pilus assembly pilin Flp
LGQKKEGTEMKKLDLRDETGAATAEYAIATMAAVGFAGLLVVIMRSDEIRTVLFDLVKSALTFTNPNASTQ